MNQMPKVSVMIPTYNQEEYIAEAIASAQAIDYDNLEIVVSDDKSTDKTKEIADKLQNERITVHTNCRNLGRVGNYHHTAHDLAIGEWAVNLDGDDYFISTTFIQDAMDVIVNHPDEKIVAYCYKHSNIEQIKKTIPYREINENAILVSGKDYFLKYAKIGRFGHPETIYRRDIGVNIGLYTLPYQACDFHSIIRILLFGNIILDKRTIAHWRIHGTNTTILESEEKQVQAMLTFDEIEKFASQFFSEEELKEWRRSMNMSSYLDYVKTYTICHRNKKSLNLLLANPALKRWYLERWGYLIFGEIFLGLKKNLRKIFKGND